MAKVQGQQQLRSGIFSPPAAAIVPGRAGSARHPLAGAGAVVAGLGGWKALSLIVPGGAAVLPAPETVLVRLWGLAASGILWRHAGVTALEAGLGFLLAAVTGLALGYLVAQSRLVEALLAPYVAATQAIPVVAVAPLMVLWFGLDLLPKVLTCAIIVFFPILVNTAVGLRTVDRALVEAARTLGAGRWQLLWYVQAPLALRSILGGLRLGVTLAMTGAVVGEFIAADAGLGYLLTYGRSIYDTSLVFSALVTLATLAIVAYAAVTALENHLIDWD